jgi:hypothetical protein
MDTTSLPPNDAVVALHSFPRRYRELATMPETENSDRILERVGVIGRSALELMVDTVRSLTLLDRALEQILVSDQPVLHPAVTSRRERNFDFAGHGGVEDILAELDDVAAAMADRAARVPADDWMRTGTVAGTPQVVTAIDVLREAVSTAADNLRDADANVRQFRSA